MADKTSAGVFGMIFEMLAEEPDPRAFALARRVWKKSFSYDFSPDQMGCDKALFKLDLAKRDVHPKYKDEGETTRYRSANGKTWAPWGY